MSKWRTSQFAFGRVILNTLFVYPVDIKLHIRLGDELVTI